MFPISSSMTSTMFSQLLFLATKLWIPEKKTGFRVILSRSQQVPHIPKSGWPAFTTNHLNFLSFTSRMLINLLARCMAAIDSWGTSLEKCIIWWLTAALSLIFSGVIKHSSTVYELERKTTLGRLGHSFSFTHIWRFKPVWDQKVPLWKYFLIQILRWRLFQLCPVGSWCLQFALLRNGGRKGGKSSLKLSLKKFSGLPGWGPTFQINGDLWSDDDFSEQINLCLGFQQCLNPSGPAGNPVESFRAKPLKF